MQPPKSPAATDPGECPLVCPDPLSALIAHIVRVHHRRLRGHLVTTWTLLDRFLGEARNGCGTLLPVREAFESVLDKLVDCMLREGGVVFPQIERLETAPGEEARGFAGALLNEIHDLERRQFTCLLAVRRLNDLTGQVEPTIQQCSVHREFAHELALFSGDLFQYLFEVNCVLLVRARALSDDQRAVLQEVRG
jgi:iron-sulfur cluster repair protein YtfE (RIC family)